MIATGLVAAGWYAMRQIPASFSYGIRAEFEVLPPDDHEFEDWMRAQPGVAKADVFRSGNSVGMMWIMTQSIGSRTPPVPDFKSAFERFGYRGLIRIDYDWRGDDWPERK